jgi:predicted MFS family arabinose efflux permease
MGWFSDRTSALLASRLNLFFSAVFVLLFLSPDDPGILLALYVFFAGFFIKSRSSLLQALLIQSGAQDARVDTQLSLYFSIGAVSGPAWTLLTGVLVDQYGMAVSLWTMAASYMFGMVILGFVGTCKGANKAVASTHNP